jgi:branched-chain amino acid transport system substrate-binding protein
VVAFESFTTKDADFSSQLTKIRQSGAQFLFTPQYYNEVALIVNQARELGFKGPILGSDSWASAETTKLCGPACNGLFYSTHYAAAGAKGKTKEFIDRYNKKYGYVPDDVAALDLGRPGPRAESHPVLRQADRRHRRRTASACVTPWPRSRSSRASPAR